MASTNSNNNDKWEQIPTAQTVQQQQPVSQVPYGQQNAGTQPQVIYAQAVPVQQVPYGQSPPMAVVYTNGGAPSQFVVMRGDQGFYDGIPKRIRCQFCNAEVITAVSHEPGCFTHFMAFGLCVVGCWPCCVLPYCIPSFMDASHRCPSCGSVVGRKNLM